MAKTRRGNRPAPQGAAAGKAAAIKAVQALLGRVQVRGQPRMGRRRRVRRANPNGNRVNRLEQGLGLQRGSRFSMAKVNGRSSENLPASKTEQWGRVLPGNNAFTFSPRGCLPKLPFADYYGQAYDAYCVVSAVIHYQASASTTSEGLLTFGVDYNNRTPISSAEGITGLSGYGSGRLYVDHRVTINVTNAMKGKKQLSCWTQDNDPFNTDAFTFYINNPSSSVCGYINISWRVTYHAPNLSSDVSNVPSSLSFMDRVDDAAEEPTAADDGNSFDSTKASGNAMKPTPEPNMIFDNGAPAGPAFIREMTFENAKEKQSATFTTLPGKEPVTVRGRVVMMPRTAAAHSLRVRYVDGGPVESDKYEIVPITTSTRDPTLLIGTHGDPRIIADILATGLNILKDITKPFVVGVVNSIYGPSSAVTLRNANACVSKYGTLPSTVTDAEEAGFSILQADDTTVITPVITAFNDGIGTDIIIPAAEATKREDTLTAAFDVRFFGTSGSSWDSRDVELAEGTPYSISVTGGLGVSDLTTITLTPNPAVTEPIRTGDTFVFTGTARGYPATDSYPAPSGLAFVDATEGWFSPLVINDSLGDDATARLSVRSLTVTAPTTVLKFVYNNNHASFAGVGHMLYNFALTRTSVTKSIEPVVATEAPSLASGRIQF